MDEIDHNIEKSAGNLRIVAVVQIEGENFQQSLVLKIRNDDNNNNNNNSKCRLCGGGDESINHIIGESNKVAQKEYKTRHD